jgi:hypothetical protein
VSDTIGHAIHDNRSRLREESARDGARDSDRLEAAVKPANVLAVQRRTQEGAQRPMRPDCDGCWTVLPVGKKPMNVPAAVADVTSGRRVCPVEVEERRH